MFRYIIPIIEEVNITNRLNKHIYQTFSLLNVSREDGQWPTLSSSAGQEKPNLKSICANVYTKFLAFFSSPQGFKFLKAKFELVCARIPKVG